MSALPRKLRALSLPPREEGLSRTLVLLHGYGADEHDLLPLAHELDGRLRAVSLQGPVSLGGPMRAWFTLAQDARGISFDPREARAALELATAAVEDIARDSPRPLLLGFSQGAAMALGIALTRPELVSAALSFSGVAPGLEAQEMAPAARLRGFPVFAAHGRADPVVSIARGRALRDELLRAFVDLTFREYDMGHSVVPEELADARAWLRARL